MPEMGSSNEQAKKNRESENQRTKQSNIKLLQPANRSNLLGPCGANFSRRMLQHALNRAGGGASSVHHTQGVGSPHADGQFLALQV